MKESVSRLEILRTDRGFTQAALAEKAGVSRQIITEIENGRVRNYRRLKLVMIARALDVEVDDLFDKAEAS